MIVPYVHTGPDNGFQAIWLPEDALPFDGLNTAAVRVEFRDPVGNVAVSGTGTFLTLRRSQEPASAVAL